MYNWQLEEQIKNLKKVNRSMFDEFITEWEEFKNVNIVKSFLKEIGWTDYQIDNIMAGPDNLNAIAEYCKNDVISVFCDFKSTSETLSRMFEEMGSDESIDNRNSRERRRHPEKFYDTKYKRPRKGEKYYGK